MQQAAERGFWTWVLVRLLRLTGIRVEELLKLIQLSILRQCEDDIVCCYSSCLPPDEPIDPYTRRPERRSNVTWHSWRCVRRATGRARGFPVDQLMLALQQIRGVAV